MTTPPPEGQNPYAQEPTTAVAQPGQPGAPQQPYAPFPGQGAPVPPPAKSKKLVRFLGIVVVVIVGLAVKFGIGWFMGQTDAETTSVGACMHNDGTNTTPDLNEVDCSDSGAEYKVVEKFDDTSDSTKCESVKEAELSYYQVGGGHNVVLCLKSV
ncbi:hypothetical protein SGFS_059740 [Streptomyces graminofaciens]|uniref:Uncharacterized protein n=1 Tax=Streptomyces graminofaciens TaxID=68212 RepID=A0ABM7FET3_9ACTN|nr:hypothetical protein [Streptomyces graminofaciens]BBC34680.1 hypothetical protein SGFS_059740 [Streptomyces graminofaciens]